MTMKTSPSRSDKGLILATPRDLFILEYLAHHWVDRYDHIKYLLSQKAGGPTKDPEGELADSTVKDQLERWQRAGWIVYERVLAAERGYAYCTRKGLRMVGLDDLYNPVPPSALRYHHYWAVSDVRLFWWEGESKKDPGIWLPERRLRAEMTTAKPDPDHYFAPIRILPGPVPDAAVSGNGWCDAIEVQLSLLKPGEMDKKLSKLCRATYRDGQTGNEYIYNDIHFYVPSEALKRQIERSKAKLDKDDQERIDVCVDADYAFFRGR